MKLDKSPGKPRQIYRETSTNPHSHLDKSTGTSTSRRFSPFGTVVHKSSARCETTCETCVKQGVKHCRAHFAEKCGDTAIRHIVHEGGGGARGRQRVRHKSRHAVDKSEGACTHAHTHTQTRDTPPTSTAAAAAAKFLMIYWWTNSWGVGGG